MTDTDTVKFPNYEKLLKIRRLLRFFHLPLIGMFCRNGLGSRVESIFTVRFSNLLLFIRIKISYSSNYKQSKPSRFYDAKVGVDQFLEND